MVIREKLLAWFSKLTKFLAHPTMDWSSLDDVGVSTEGGYDKQAIKKMIERKRKNDLIRRKEFDKLRSREGRGVGVMARVSVSASSLVTDQGGREVTLKKIDEIEAQMSKQWWKGRQTPSLAEVADESTQVHSRDAQAQRTDAERLSRPFLKSRRQFIPTRPIGFGVQALEQADTEVGVGMSSELPSRLASGQHVAAIPKRVLSGGALPITGTLATKFFSAQDPSIQTDPELEEAAIRFANKDDAGAERSLLQALRGSHATPELALSWVSALLDLYRVTNKRVEFDSALVEFSSYLANSSPLWTRGVGTPEPQSKETQAVSSMRDQEPHKEIVKAPSHPVWICPELLSVTAMEQLRLAITVNPMPWHLDWSQLQRISVDAMSMLGEFFGGLCDESVDLQVSGASALVRTLHAMVPSGRRDVNAAWWGVRLNVLRAMQLREEFQRAAVDCHETYGVPTPVWTPSSCRCVDASLAQPTGVDAQRALLAAQARAASLEAADPSLHMLTLKGELLGDATQAFSGLSGATLAGQRIVVQCAHLVRVDFSAAGSLLSWAATRQSEGCHVEFRNVHGLVAAFFHLIGISAHGLVVPKAI